VSEFAPDRRVLEALWLMVAVDGELIRGECSPPPGRGLPEVMHPWDFPAEDRYLVDWLERMSADREIRLGAGSRRRRGFGTADRARVLWCRVESRREADNLQRFRPAPTLIVREGATHRRVALWSLREPLTYEWLVRANKRIAHRLYAAKKHAAPEFSFPVPGSCLRLGRCRPVPVLLERFEPVIYRPRDVVGGLREAPDPSAWRALAPA
jgi:hypothetical protein